MKHYHRHQPVMLLLSALQVEDDPSYLDELINVLKSRDRDLYDKLCLVRSEIPDIISDIVNGVNMNIADLFASAAVVFFAAFDIDFRCLQIPSQGGSGGCCVVL